MNASDLRQVDFDAYRQRAHQLRNQAVQAFIDRAVASVKAALRFRPRDSFRDARGARPIGCEA
jgi:hypothetical protein